MQIVYTCPKCGADLRDVILTCNPPIHKKVCSNCGWESTEPKEDVVRIPYYDNTLIDEKPSPCKHCSNNPSNGGSGICHCILGLNTIY